MHQEEMGGGVGVWCLVFGVWRGSHHLLELRDGHAVQQLPLLPAQLLPVLILRARRGDLRLIDSCITQLKAQRPSRTCNESKEEEEEASCAPSMSTCEKSAETLST